MKKKKGRKLISKKNGCWTKKKVDKNKEKQKSGPGSNSNNGLFQSSRSRASPPYGV